MILHLKYGIDPDEAATLARELNAVHLQKNGQAILITSSGIDSLEEKYQVLVDQSFVTDSDIQLASRFYRPETREIKIGKNFIGGQHNTTLVITGPCSVESEGQIRKSAELLVGLGLTTLRAGAYKPRTSPYTFQGLGLEGLKLLAKIREEYGLNIITEAKDATHIDSVIEYADIVQIGAKAMYDQGILKKAAKANKPVLLKRGFGSTLQEFVQAAEFLLSGGNEHVILCERGIRTFETKTRFTLDLCGVAYLKQHVNLPVVVDPSHAMGYSYGVPDLARAATAMGVDGLLIETHPDPRTAQSDGAQQLDHDTFKDLYHSLKNVAGAVGRTII